QMTLQNINSYSKLREVEFKHLRHRLASALRAQPNNGGVERKYLDAHHIDGTSCSRALGLEWERFKKDVDELCLHPGMSERQLQALNDQHDLIDRIQHARRVIQIWIAAREFLNRADIDVSGNLTLAQDNGQRTVEWRGIRPIGGAVTGPSLLLDATLPPLPILQIYHPRAQVVADIKVELPKSVHIRQLQGAPTSKRKLERVHYLVLVRRHILARYLELGRPHTLVICQQKVEEWLKQSGLPGDIELRHYNDVTGLDDYRDVRLMLLIGRTAPGPAAMEALAAALTGKCPVPVTTGNNGFRWYDQVQRGIRLRAGSGIATAGDQHPDPDVEALRWQIHEGELVQALGRGRGINRTAVNPLDADLLFDSALPVTVDEVQHWRPPSLLIETAIEGVMLTSRVDLVRLWQHLGPNDTAARRTLQQPIPTLPGFEQVEYQLAGPKMNKRVGYFDRTLIHDPRAWLEAKLGALV